MRICDDLPCGKCDAGIYDAHPYLIGVEMFRGCLTAKDALKAAPRCKTDGSHICFGARDFIACTKFPLTEEEIESIRSELGEVA